MGWRTTLHVFTDDGEDGFFLLVHSVGAVEGYNLQVHNQDVHTKVVLKVG
jgi:hypothetical protein